MTGGRSVYSEAELISWKATISKPVKVINYLLAGYIHPPITLDELLEMRIFTGHPSQSVFEISRPKLMKLLPRLNLDFQL